MATTTLKNTIDNILLVMRNDERYAGVKFNQLNNAPEITIDGKPRRWSDTDEAESKRYIEKQYNIHNDAKHYDALRILFRARISSHTRYCRQAQMGWYRAHR